MPVRNLVPVHYKQSASAAAVCMREQSDTAYATCPNLEGQSPTAMFFPMPAGPAGHTRTRKGCSRPQCPTSSSSLFSGSPGSGPLSCLIRGPLSARGAPGCDICGCRSRFFLHSPVMCNRAAGVISYRVCWVESLRENHSRHVC